jgi:hypothetical protein
MVFSLMIKICETACLQRGPTLMIPFLFILLDNDINRRSQYAISYYYNEKVFQES